MMNLLRRAGLKTASFGYTTTFEDFTSINTRLVKQIISLAKTDRYIVVGHSLGGVLLRAALNSLPVTINRPDQVFLLGSPVHASRLAKYLKNNILYRAFTGDCGQLLSSSKRMHQVGPLKDTTTSIMGVKGISITKKFFGEEPNDGVVSISEVNDNWIYSKIQVQIVHTLLPSSRHVTKIILNKALHLQNCPI
ncbi:MAG: alpha/beta hydrolase [Methylococcales bacterium]|jgi:triacylglycerol esterase/lipase EstA (alpha/beta hydrolase family)|nr:alpha/beta hydrolase [Methylococcales bacterium]